MVLKDDNDNKMMIIQIISHVFRKNLIAELEQNDLTQPNSRTFAYFPCFSHFQLQQGSSFQM